MSIFLRLYPDLVHSVKHCVLTVAVHCYSIGLITKYTYEQIIQRVGLTDQHKAIILLDNVHTVLSSKPSALKEFNTVLFQTGDCKPVANKIQQLL